MPNGSEQEPGPWYPERAYTERYFGAMESLRGSESEDVVRFKGREVAFYSFDLLWDREDSQPNPWVSDGALREIRGRVRDLGMGALGRDKLIEMGYTPGELKAAGIDLKSPEKDLSEAHRERLIASLVQAQREITNLGWLNEGVAETLRATGDYATEASFLTDPRVTRPSISIVETIAEMPPTIEGDRSFGRKMTIALRALDEVARGKAIGVPMVFAQEPHLGMRRLALGYMLRAVAGIEATESLWKESPHEQFRDPIKYALMEALPQDIESLNAELMAGVLGRDYTDEERARQVEAYRRKMEWEKARERGEDVGLPDIEIAGIPDIKTFEYKIRANPKLADSLNACQIAWYFYRWMRKDVQRCIQRTPRKVTAESEYHTIMGVPVGEDIWHGENGSQAGDLMVMAHPSVRLAEETFDREVVRWSGPVRLIGTITEMSLSWDEFCFITREIDLKEEAEERKRQGIEMEEKDIPESETRFLTVSKLLFEATVKDEKGRDRPVYLDEIPWGQTYWEDEKLLNSVLGVKDSQERPRKWKAPTMSREDTMLLKRLEQYYFLKLFIMQFLKPEKGFEETEKAIRDPRWQELNAKPAQVGMILLFLAKGLPVDDAVNMTYLQMCNLQGSMIYHCFAPRKTVDDKERYTREHTRSMPRGGVGYGRDLGKRKIELEKHIRETIDAVMDADVAPQPGWAPPPPRPIRLTEEELKKMTAEEARIEKKKREKKEEERKAKKAEESTQKAQLYARMLSYVATTGWALLPGDVPELFSNESVEAIKESGLYFPYNVIKRDEVAKGFAQYGNGLIPGEVRKRVLLNR